MRNNQAKPGIDWYEIESRVKGGESLLSISKDYDISREAIRKRSLKEGWLETNKNKGIINKFFIIILIYEK